MDFDDPRFEASLRTIALLASRLVRHVDQERAREELDDYVRKPAVSEAQDGPLLWAIASAEYQSRRLRERMIKFSAFADPAWDMLLDLFIEGSKGKLVSVKSACIASRAPNTTALRYIQLLQDEGLIAKRGDPADGRRQLLALTVEGRRQMVRYLRLRHYEIEISPTLMPNGGFLGVDNIAGRHEMAEC